MRIARASNGTKGCAALSMCSGAFLHLKCSSRHRLRQGEKITLQEPGYPCTTVVICFEASVPRLRVSECWPNTLSPIACKNCTTRMTASQAFPRRFSSGVRTDLPMSKCCSHGNLLRFSRVPISCTLIATTTKICTRYTIHAGSRQTLLLVPHALLRGSGLVTTSQPAYHR